LEEKKVSQRMAEECQKILSSQGYKVEIEEIYDTSSLQEGAALAIYAGTSSGSIIGSDRAGRPGRRSESIGRYVAQGLIEDITTGAAVDRYIADQVIIYAGLAEGISQYSIPRITEHIETNLWLIEEFLGARTKISGNLIIEIEGIGF
jgi:RNA 3'-terminal phosphate cyclase